MKGGNLQAGSSPAPTYRARRGGRAAYAGRQAGTRAKAECPWPPIPRLTAVSAGQVACWRSNARPCERGRCVADLGVSGLPWLRARRGSLSDGPVSFGYQETFHPIRRGSAMGNSPIRSDH